MRVTLFRGSLLLKFGGQFLSSQEFLGLSKSENWRKWRHAISRQKNNSTKWQLGEKEGHVNNMGRNSLTRSHTPNSNYRDYSTSIINQVHNPLSSHDEKIQLNSV